jgi:elongation factor 2
MAKILREKGWNADEAKNVSAVDISGNILIDETKGVQFIQESMDSIRSGFDDVIHSGPIARETLRGVKFVLHHFVPHEDPAHRGLAQLMPATRRSMLGSMLLAEPAILEPVLGMEIKCPQEQIGTVAGILSGKRGKLLNVEKRSNYHYTG